MTIYIVLLALIALTFFYFKLIGKNTEKDKIICLNIAFILLYLLFALRAPTVGRDIPSYKEMYEKTKLVSWNDYDFVYFEVGYTFLMKIFTALNLPFQVFMAFVSFVILFPIYLYIKKYSKNYFLSVLTYICYIFLDFNLSGVRQSMAGSIVLLAYIVLRESKRHTYFKYVLLIAAAAFLHRSALIGFLPLIILNVKNLYAYITLIFGSSVFVAIFREQLLNYIRVFFGKEEIESNIYIGRNLFFTVILSVTAVFVLHYKYYKEKHTDFGNASELKESYNTEFQIDKIFWLSIPTALLGGDNTFSRAYMMFSQVIVVFLPNLVESFDYKTRAIISPALCCFLLGFFYFITLIPGGFDIVPYVFFWQ